MGRSHWQKHADHELKALQRRVDELLDRGPETGAPRQTRLAITVPDTESEYPNRSECPNTYQICFCDGSYFREQGYRVHDLLNRQELDNPRFLAHNIIDGYDCYVEPYTLLLVHWMPLGAVGEPQCWFEYWGQGTACSSGGSSGEPASSAPGPGESSAPESSAPESSGPSSGESSAPSAAENLCLDVITAVWIDEEACELCYCKRTICLVPGSTIGPATCTCETSSGLSSSGA